MLIVWLFFRFLSRQDRWDWSRALGSLLVWISRGHHPRHRGHRADRSRHQLLDHLQPRHHLGQPRVLLLTHIFLQLGLQSGACGLSLHCHGGHHLLVRLPVDHGGVGVAGGGLEVLQDRCSPHTDRQSSPGPENCQVQAQGRHRTAATILWAQIKKISEKWIRLRSQWRIRKTDHEWSHHEGSWSCRREIKERRSKVTKRD